MDRAEAIEILEYERDTDVFVSDYRNRVHEALELAIEALKEPTGDYEFFGGTYAKEGDAESATTTDFISRADAIEALTGWKTDLPDEDIARELNALPPVTPAERAGEWIPCTKEGLSLTELGRREGQKWYGYKCSKCNFIYKGNALTESPFCQDCGAKMGGDE